MNGVTITPPVKKVEQIKLANLSTPFKLAEFVVNVPTKYKEKYAFLMDEAQTTSMPTQPTRQTTKTSLKPTKIMPTKSAFIKSQRKKRKTKKKKKNKKLKKKGAMQNMASDDPYNPNYDDALDGVGPRSSTSNLMSTARKTSTNVFKNLPVSSSLGPFQHTQSLAIDDSDSVNSNEENTDVPLQGLGQLSIPAPFEPDLDIGTNDNMDMSNQPDFQYSVSMLDAITPKKVAKVDELKFNGLNDASDLDISDSNSDSQHSSDMSISEETDDSDDSDVDISMGINQQDSEKKICVKIAKVLYENSWTGKMIANASDFSRREYNALLECGNVGTDMYIVNLVWQIIFYSQRKSEDELINEDKEHIKWYWYDCNDILSDWKWRKYNVIICQWISDRYKAYLASKRDEIEVINFNECQQKFEKDQRRNIKEQRHRPEFKDNESENEEDDDAKRSELAEDEESSGRRRKKITIDDKFDVNSHFNHFLVFEKDHIWHRIQGNDQREYSREIRIEYKLFDVEPDMMAMTYQQNPSPFVIPNLLAVDA